MDGRSEKTHESKQHDQPRSCGSEDFAAIDPQQSFYWDDQGALTLVFDEAKVAPASLGVVEFHIPQEVTQPLGLKAP